MPTQRSTSTRKPTRMDPGELSRLREIFDPNKQVAPASQPMWEPPTWVSPRTSPTASAAKVNALLAHIDALEAEIEDAESRARRSNGKIKALLSFLGSNQEPEQIPDGSVAIYSTEMVRGLARCGLFLEQGAPAGAIWNHCRRVMPLAREAGLVADLGPETMIGDALTEVIQRVEADLGELKTTLEPFIRRRNG